MLKALTLLAVVMGCAPRPGQEWPTSTTPRLMSMTDVEDSAGTLSVQDSSYFLMPAHLLLAALADAAVQAELRRQRVDGRALAEAIERQRHSEGIASPSDSETAAFVIESAAILQTAAALAAPKEPVRPIQVVRAILQEPRAYVDPVMPPGELERRFALIDRANSLFECIAQQPQARCASLADGADIRILESVDSFHRPPLVLRPGIGWAATRAILQRHGAE